MTTATVPETEAVPVEVPQEPVTAQEPQRRTRALPRAKTLAR